MLPLDGSIGPAGAIVGNKGHLIDLMAGNRLPVPPAFCLTTAVGERFLDRGPGALDEVWGDVLANLRRLERQTGRSFGHGPHPLLVSVRGGAAVSMPGMLGTVLNVGVTDAVRAALTDAYGPRVADEIADRYRTGYAALCRTPGPADPQRQLRAAIAAVFASWAGSPAQVYRRHRGLADRGGTAVLIQAMVFGNLTAESGTGVLFSADPVSGRAEPFGEWLPRCQGPELVSGVADALPLTALADEQPGVYRQLLAAIGKLEELIGPVEIEFTVEAGQAWLLQARAAARPARQPARSVSEFHGGALLLATGIPACAGIAAGLCCADVDTALAQAARGVDVILVRPTTSPEDIAGMIAARGVVTEVGGVTSHAAVLSRELGRPTVVGCGPGVVDLLDGRPIILDGSRGHVRG